MRLFLPVSLSYKLHFRLMSKEFFKSIEILSFFIVESSTASLPDFDSTDSTPSTIQCKYNDLGDKTICVPLPQFN